MLYDPRKEGDILQLHLSITASTSPQRRATSLFLVSSNEKIIRTSWTPYYSACCHLGRLDTLFFFVEIATSRNYGVQNKTEQLAPASCNLLHSHCQSIYQCCGGRLQVFHQKSIWCDSIFIFLRFTTQQPGTKF